MRNLINTSKTTRFRTIILWAFLLTQATAVAILLRCWTEAGRDPIVVRYSIGISGWPADQRPMSVAFLSDTHVSGHPAASRIDPAKLSEIIRQVNSLKPDLVVLGGDYISGKAGRDNPISFKASVAPFINLRAPKGVYGVLGNHDYERGDNRTVLQNALLSAGVKPLVNDSVDLGAFILAGIDDLWFGRPDSRILSKLAVIGKPVVLTSHNPDVFPNVPASIILTLAGHTHGGQIAPSITGPLFSSSTYGQRYRRGLIREDRHLLLVSSGIGGPPFRWNVPPEIVMLKIGPEAPKISHGHSR